MITALSARGRFELPQLLQSFGIAVFRCGAKQDPGLLAVFGDAIASEIKLRKWS
jgi:hypothetical protein